jgi:hypothetical protein
MAAVAGGLMTATASNAAATPAACATSTVIEIAHFAFNPPAVPPGGSSTATLTALNCTGQTQQTSEVWSGRFAGPNPGIPPGCPVIDPVTLAASFPPHGTVSTSRTYLVPSSCTATQLIVSVNIDGKTGTVLAHGTAILEIIIQH